MEESFDNQANAQNEEVKQLKRKLESWREVVIILHSIFIWQKSFFPAVIAGGSLLMFIVLWLLDLSVLTTFSILGITVCVLDYAVPVISLSVFSPDNWTGSKERQFETICLEIVELKQMLVHYYNMLGRWKEERPKMYFCGAVSTLVVFGWIGNNINNIFLTFLFLTFVLLVPGLKHHGLIEKYSAHVILAISNALGHKIKKN